MLGFEDARRLLQKVDLESVACDLAVLLGEMRGQSVDDALSLLDVSGPLALALVLVAQDVGGKAGQLASSYLHGVRKGSALQGALYVMHHREQMLAQISRFSLALLERRLKHTHTHTLQFAALVSFSSFETHTP